MKKFLNFIYSREKINGYKIKRFLGITIKKERIPFILHDKRVSKVGKCTYSAKDIEIEYPDNIQIGSFCSIGRNVRLGAGEHPTNYLSSSPFTYLNDLGYINKTTYKQEKKEIVIGNDVWIGDNVFVKCGITIGDGAIIGAGAIVTRDIPAYAIAVGIPAKVIKYRFSNETIKELLRIKWWDLPDNIIQEIPFENIENAIKYLNNIK